jgi:hypothetical protein
MPAHGKATQISVEGLDVSLWTSNSEFTRKIGTSPTTGYGKDDEEYGANLKDADFTMDGKYDVTASTGTSALDAMHGQQVTVIRKMRGTGTGKPTQTFEAILEEYKETSPYNDYVKWSAKLKCTGPVVTTSQA